MKSILYTQNTSSTEPNTIVVDDNISSDFQSEEQIEAFQFICKQDEKKGEELKKIDKLKKCGKIKSKNFKFFTDDCGMFLKGCFVEEDNVGRNMPYMFWMDTNNIEDFCRSLNVVASKLNRTCQEDVLEVYKLIKGKNKSHKFILILSVILLILIIAIWNIQTN